MTYQWRLTYAVTIFAWLISWPVVGAQWQIKVTDHLGKPLPDAVIELVSPTAMAHDDTVQRSAHNQQYKMLQQHKQFQPFVLAVPVGSEVDFPNLDATRHHVYSFSKAKVFEIKLYKDRPHSPILFDQSGVVALGCNIHDRMEAHIYVASSPWVVVTDAKGMATFSSLQPAKYQVKLWHPWQRRGREPVEITLAEDRVDHFKIFAVKPDTALVGSPRY